MQPAPVRPTKAYPKLCAEAASLTTAPARLVALSWRDAPMGPLALRNPSLPAARLVEALRSGKPAAWDNPAAPFALWDLPAEQVRAGAVACGLELARLRKEGKAYPVSDAMRGLLLWADEQALLATLPDPPRLPPKATGQRATRRAAGTTPLSPAEVAAMLDSLPEWSSDREDRYPVKAYFEVAAETGLRPATLYGLRAPDHWRPGRTDLTIPAALDKSRWERVVPLSARAIAALTHAAPVEGRIFGEHDYRGWLRRAALAAGLPHERASRVVPYDLRHARATGLLAAGASLPGVQHLLGHRLASTTDRYTHPGPDHARAALARVAPPVQASGPIVGPRGVWGWRCDGPPEPSSPPVFPC